jgi:cytochrome c-type biogenesis protein CcmH
LKPQPGAWCGAAVLLTALAGIGQRAADDPGLAQLARPAATVAAQSSAAERSVADELATLQRLGMAAQPGGAQPSLEQRRAELQRVVERDPRNGRAWALLGLVHGEAGQFAQAANAFEQALAASPKVALDPAVWCEYADVLGMAQGTLAGKPTEAIQKALALRSDHPKALEMAGSAAYERRDFAAAAHFWGRLLPQIDDASPARQQLIAAIARAQRQAAVALPLR